MKPKDALPKMSMYAIVRLVVFEAMRQMTITEVMRQMIKYPNFANLYFKKTIAGKTNMMKLKIPVKGFRLAYEKVVQSETRKIISA